MNMLTDPAGKISSARVLNIAVTLIVMGVWASLSITDGVMYALDPGLIGVIAVLTGGKTAQSFAEKGVQDD